MKFSATTCALIVIVGLVSASSAFPSQKRMIYYQRPAQYYAAPQRMMYVQYMHPSPSARSTQAAEALVAGESVATGTYLQDCDHTEADVAAAGPAVSYEAPNTDDLVAEHGEDILSEAGVHAAQAEAEAYPTATGEESLTTFDVPVEVDIVAEENEVSDDDAKVPRDYNFDAAGEAVPAEDSVAVEETVAAEEEVSAVNVEVAAEVPLENPVEAPLDEAVPAEVPVPTAAPIAPATKPVNRYLPAKKKIYVELDHSVEDTGLVAASEEAAGDEDEEDNVAAVATVTRRPARRPAVKKPAKAVATPKKEQAPLPVGSFFPINFGGTSGGAIAIANSFSTGEGGSATSHAIAYGSPDSASLRGCVSCKKH